MVNIKRVVSVMSILWLTMIVLFSIFIVQSGHVVHADQSNKSLWNNFFRDQDSFGEAMKQANNPNYFDSDNEGDYYTKMPKKTTYITVKGIVGASKTPNGLPTYPLLDIYMNLSKVYKIIDNGGKYRALTKNIDGKYIYVTTNKRYVKFISKSVHDNITWEEPPANSDIAKGDSVAAPAIVSEALSAKTYGKPPYSKEVQENAARRLQRYGRVLGKYFYHKGIHSKEYYIKRYKYYDKVFGLHGYSSLSNWKNWQ